MKYTSILALAVALTLPSLATAEKGKEIKSGLQAGEFVGPFYVTKVAGADEDGVKVGKNLCYRCMNGGRPQVMVFTRSTDKPVTELVQALDKAIKDNKNLRTFVNLLGEDKDELGEVAEKFAKTSKTKNVPFVVPNEFENGPEDYGISDKADVTILLAVGGKVMANHAVAKAEDLDTKAVVKSLGKILN